MNYEEFRDLTREQKDKLLFDVVCIMTAPTVSKILEQLLSVAKTKEPLVFSKEKSINEYHGLNVTFPDMPDEVKEMIMRHEGFSTLGMMLLDPSDYWCKLLKDSDELVAMAESVTKLFNTAVSKRNDGFDLSIEQSVLTEYGTAMVPIAGFKLSDKGVLSFYGDPDMHPICVIWHDDDLMLVYEQSWVAFTKKSATAESPKPANVYRLN